MAVSARQAAAMTGSGAAARPFKSGYVAIVGRPNTGKSTLLNGFLRRKISIVSRRPQTTRWQLRGVKTTDSHQLVFVDTPGYQSAVSRANGGANHHKIRAIDKLMNREVVHSLSYCDLIVWVAVAMQWRAEDELLLPLLKEAAAPVILLLNKVDLVAGKQDLLPYVDRLRRLHAFRGIIPLTARRAKDIARLESEISACMPPGGLLYDADAITDRGERFIAAEYLREQIFAQTGDELPYRTAVTIEKYAERERFVSIYATIWTERPSHRAILIGARGARLKRIGQATRERLQTLLQKEVLLKTWVKIKRDWSDDIRALRRLGYLDVAQDG